LERCLHICERETERGLSVEELGFNRDFVDEQGQGSLARDTKVFQPLEGTDFPIAGDSFEDDKSSSHQSALHNQDTTSNGIIFTTAGEGAPVSVDQRLSSTAKNTYIQLQ
jgi:hypothetical protein